MREIQRDPAVVAPCGVNCNFCYVFLRKKKPCLGCRGMDSSKPNHCRACKIKDCAKDKGLEYCWDCSQYPCTLIKRMDKSYTQRYNEPIIAQAQFIKEEGWKAYFDRENQRLRCPSCHGLITIHGKKCGDCD